MSEDASQENAKYMSGPRAMRGAPMGKSVFRLLRAARPTIMNLEHQQDLKQMGNAVAMPWKPASPVKGFGGP